jgi:hypothetical protein
MRQVLILINIKEGRSYPGVSLSLRKSAPIDPLIALNPGGISQQMREASIATRRSFQNAKDAVKEWKSFWQRQVGFEVTALA